MAEEKAEEKEIKNAEKPKMDWVKIKPAELEKIIIDLYKQGESTAKIGIILRDKHGVPKTRLIGGKRISQILKEAKIKISPEKEIIQKRIDALNAHIGKNKHDIPAKKKLAASLWALKKAR
jgi:small subunit ribosomal protein S15